MREELMSFLVLFPIGLSIFFTFVPTSICGLLSSLLSIASNLSPLEKMTDVIDTRDYRFINLSIAVATSFNAAVWTCYAFLTRDIFIFVSQFISL